MHDFAEQVCGRPKVTWMRQSTALSQPLCYLSGIVTQESRFNIAGLLCVHGVVAFVIEIARHKAGHSRALFSLS